MTDRLTELTCRYLDRVITPDEFAELDALIASDADAAARFRELSVQARILSEPLRDRIEQLHDAVSPAPVSSEGVPIYRKGCEPKPILKAAKVRMAFALAAALLVACGLGAYFFVFSTDAQPQNPAPSERPVATLIHSAGGSLTTPNGYPAAGSDYAAGEYTLDSGAAEFMLTNSVNVKLRGETRLRMHNDMNVILTRGQADFVVPENARGFTVALPSGLRVVDLGTRFRVFVDEAGESEVIVTSGHVALVDSDESLQLTPGLTAIVGPAGEIALRHATELVPQSVGIVVGLAQANSSTGYQELDSGELKVGVDGSIATESRRASNPIVTFDISKLRGRLTGAKLTAVKAGQRFQSGKPFAVDIGLVTVDRSPEKLGADLYAAGPFDNDPYARTAAEAFASSGTPDGETVTADLFDALAPLFDSDGHPVRDTIVVRLSPDRQLTVNEIDRIVFDHDLFRLELEFIPESTLNPSSDPSRVAENPADTRDATSVSPEK